MVYFPDQTDSIFTRRNSKFMILACWILPILIMIPTVTNHWIKMDCKTRSCTITEEYKKILLSMVFLPGLVLLLSNVMIYIKVSNTVRNSTCFLKPFSSNLLFRDPTIFSWNGTPSATFLVTFFEMFWEMRFCAIKKVWIWCYMPVLKMIEHNMRKSAHVVYKIFAAFENSFIIAFFLIATYETSIISY